MLQAEQTGKGTLNSMTENFLITSASEPNISINQKLVLKKKLVKFPFMKYITVKISIWAISKN